MSRTNHKGLKYLAKEHMDGDTRIKVAYTEGLGAYKDCSISLKDFVKSVEKILHG